MSKNQYMEILLEQIRSKKAREIVSKEIGAHIDDQAEVYQSKGMNKTEAERRAVWEMGDPVKRACLWTEFTNRRCHGE